MSHDDDDDNKRGGVQARAEECSSLLTLMTPSDENVVVASAR